MRVKYLLPSLALVLLLSFAGKTVHAQHHLGGIKKVEEADHLVTYDIRVERMDGASEARRLENGLLEKQGIVQADADAQQRVVRVVVKPIIDPKILESIVDYHGFVVSKSFDE